MASPTFQAALGAGRALFEQGRFHAAHEAWESGWRRTRGDERQVLQSLVLWAAALHHHQRGKELGATRLLTRAMERLGEVDGTLGGLDVEWLREALITSLERARQPWSADAQPVWPAASVASFDAELEHPEHCPWCGEPVLVAIAPEDAMGSTSIEDCPVCCRPWLVCVTVDDGVPRVQLRRER